MSAAAHGAASKTLRGVPMPRFWVGLALIVWGVFTDSLLPAVLMAVMLEALGHGPIKWALRDLDYHRAADLTTAIFAVMTIVQFSRYSVHGIYEVLAILPYCFFPLVLVQRASTEQTIPMSALFYRLRARDDLPRWRVDVDPYYVITCILSAGTAVRQGITFIVVIGVLIVGVLAASRPRRYSAWLWAAMMSTAMLATAATQIGILTTQKHLEASFLYWVNQFPWAHHDPNMAFTAIGAIGRLKLSDQIRLRVIPGPGVQVPMLLPEASFDSFKFGTWSANNAKFEALDKIAGRDAWQIDRSQAAAPASVEIIVQHRQELVRLPLPRGTRVVESGEIAELQDNRFGAILAESPPGALRYRATAGAPHTLEPPPLDGDLVVPAPYRELMRAAAAEIGLDGLSASAQAAKIRRFFLDNFKYSLIQPGVYRRQPLQNFLQRTRRGHCEYFATAAVLLARHVGIPARYTVGYSVESYSPLERAYIARARHAHSWALVYVDGAWVVLDATPAVWFELEEDYASQWQTLQDLMTWLWYRYQRLNQADFSELQSW